VYIKEFIEYIKHLGNLFSITLSFKREESIKPLHIEDVIWHLTSDKYIINPLRIYSLYKEGKKYIDVYKRPYLGVVSDDISYAKAIKYFAETINIKTLILGTINKHVNKKSLNIFKLVDIGLIIVKNIKDFLESVDVIDVELFKLNSLRGFRNIILLNYLETFPVILYLIRPSFHLLYGNPLILYPLYKLKLSYDQFILYLDNRYNMVKDIEDLRYIGLKVGDKYYIEDIMEGSYLSDVSKPSSLSI